MTPVLATHIMNGRMRNIQAEKDEFVTILTGRAGSRNARRALPFTDVSTQIGG